MQFVAAGKTARGRIRVFERLKYQGIWWVPNDPQSNLSGNLSYQPGDSLQLEVQGSFGDGTVPVILGVTSTGRAVTLFRCPLVWSQTSLPGTTSARYIATWALVGRHYAGEGEAVFRRIDGEFEHLSAWVRVSGVRAAPTDGGSTFGSFAYEQPAAIEARVRLPKHGHEAVVALQWLPTVSRDTHRASVEEKVAAVLTLETTDVRFRDLMESLYDVVLLTAMGAGTGLSPLSLTLHTQESLTDPIHHHEVELYFAPTGNAREHSYADEFLPFDVVLSDFGSLVPRWMELTERLRHSLVFYKAVLNRQVPGPDLGCLTMTFALEGLHRSVCKPLVVAKSEHRRKVKEVVDLLPQHHKMWVRERLSGANVKSLGQSLGELGTRAPEVANALGWTQEFVRRVVNTRNSHSHALTPNAAREVLRGSQLIGAVARLRLMFEAQLLLELGFEQSRVLELVGRARSGRFV